MGKIRVKTLGDEEFEKQQATEAKKRREEKKAKKAKDGETSVAGDQADTDKTQSAGEQQAEKKERKLKIRVRSKRYQELRALVDQNKLYSVKDAVSLVKKTANTKFDGSVEVHININPATLPKDKKNLSGSVNLPHGTGKKRIIAIADDAILEKIQKGQIDFDVLVAHPSMMPKLARVAKVLGPKGLMPNPKNGTVAPDPEKRAKELEGGELNWKTEPDQPILHQAIGKVSFEEKQLKENLTALTQSVKVSNIMKLTLTSSMGPGIKVDPATLG